MKKTGRTEAGNGRKKGKKEGRWKFRRMKSEDGVGDE
jgi:hypothetical protein